MIEAEKPGEERLLALREELRSLGYLEGYLGRYVLGDFVSRPRLLGPALGSCLRAALVGAPLLAVALSVAAALWSPLLRARPLDVLVVALYASLLALPAVFLLSLGGAVLGLLATSRPAPLARAVHIAVTLVGLGYLLAWWWPRAGARGGFAASNLLVLLLLAGVAFLEGRLAGLAALAVSLDLKAGGRGGAARRATLRTSLVVLGIGALLAILLVAGGRPDPEAPPLTASAPPPRVFVLGVDGLSSEDLAGPLRSAQAAVFALETSAVRVPPVVWTTIATGRDPLDHGVQSLLVERIPGLDTTFVSGYGSDALHAVARSLLPTRPPLAPLDERLRRQMSFWEIASLAGLEVAAINWWATYPAQVTRGRIVSDRAYAALAAGQPLAREAWPPELGRALELGFAELRASLELPLPVGSRGQDAPERQAAASDAFHAALALAELRETDAPLVTVYLQALDVLRSAAAAAPRGALAEASQVYQGFLARLLDEARAALAPGGVLVLVGDPGRSRAGGRGVLALEGFGIRPLEAVDSARLVDVAPSLLTLLGIPLSGELEGRALLEAFEPELIAGRPPRQVPRYAPRMLEPLPDDPGSDDMIRERLRSLGYIQ